MKKIELGQLLTILANVGVIAGILLLAYELDQNRRMTQAQTRSAVSDQLSNLVFEEINTPGMVDVVLKTQAGEPLTPREQLLFDRRQTAYWRYRENVHYQYRNGLYEDSEYLAQREVWIRILNGTEADRAEWCRRQGQHSPEFVSEMNSLLDKPCE